MYHTAFSRLSRSEIDEMLKLLANLDSKGKYSGMRLLPLSIADIEKALEKAKNGDLRSLSLKTPMSKIGGSTQKSSESNADGVSTTPYGHWINKTEQNQSFSKTVNKYADEIDNSEDERKKLEEKKKQEEKENENELKQELERERKRKEKIQRDYENAQRINDERLKEYMKKQRALQELRKLEEADKRNTEIDNLKRQLNKKISKLNSMIIIILNNSI